MSVALARSLLASEPPRSLPGTACATVFSPPPILAAHAPSPPAQTPRDTLSPPAHARSYGYITPGGEYGGASPDLIPSLVDRYLRDSNSLKSLEMKKVVVGFDFNLLERCVHDHVRGVLGWWRGLSVTFPKHNYKVRVYDDNCLAALWENKCCNCLMHVTIVPCLLMRCYRDCGDHFSDDLRSHFQIQYHPLQVFAALQPALWCPGQNIGAMASELFRDMFW